MTQQDSSKTLSIALLLLVLIASLYLGYERTGLLPWVGVMLGGVGLALTTFLAGQRLMYYAVLVFALMGLSWAGSIWYVYSSWESGEVVEIQLHETVKIRTWIVEQDGKELVIYDSPRENQALVEGGKMVSVTRGEETYRADLQAVRAEDLEPQISDAIYALYLQKHPRASSATDVYHLTIGPRRGSQLYVLYLTKSEA